jgi:hypothetical protein
VLPGGAGKGGCLSSKCNDFFHQRDITSQHRVM